MPMTGVLTRKAAEKVRRMTGRRVPIIYTAHGFHFYKGAPLSNWLYYPLERHYARYTDELILINEEDYERGSKFPVRGDVDRISGVGVLPLPDKTPSFDLRQQYGIPEDHKVIVSVGELTERKNHELVICAMDRLRREKVTYVICGTGPLEKELHRMVKEMHLGDQVIFAGYCECVRDVLQQADIFAFPSRQEGLPVAVLEAMQSGLPVLAQDIRGNHDLIRDGEGGFLFEEFLPEDYVRGIRYFLKYPQEAERMGEWNRTQVKAYTRDVVDEQMKKIYDKWTDGSCL
jgi:glycosyltransferase EpsD